MEQAQATTDQVVQVNVEEIVPSPFQTRTHFDQTKLAELAESIKSNGLIQPIVIRLKVDGKHQLIAGERRWRAHKLAGLATVKSIVMEVTDEQAREMVLIENLQRDDLTLMEEARGLAQLVEVLCSRNAVADRISKSVQYVNDRVDMVELPLVVQNMLDEEKINLAQAKVILEIEGNEKRVEAANLAVKLTLSASQLKARFQRHLKSKEKPEGEGGGGGDPTVKFAQVSSSVVKLYDAVEKFDFDMLRDTKKRGTLDKQIELLQKALERARTKLAQTVEEEVALPAKAATKAAK